MPFFLIEFVIFKKKTNTRRIKFTQKYKIILNKLNLTASYIVTTKIREQYVFSLFKFGFMHVMYPVFI